MKKTNATFWSSLTTNLWFWVLAVCVIGIIFLGYKRPNSIRSRAQTVNVLHAYQDALTRYYTEYHRVPWMSENIHELKATLAGVNHREQNEKRINFLKATNYTTLDFIHDGWKRELLVLRRDGLMSTNIVIRSLWKNGVNDGGKFDDVEISTDNITTGNKDPSRMNP